MRLCGLSACVMVLLSTAMILAQHAADDWTGLMKQLLSGGVEIAASDVSLSAPIVDPHDDNLDWPAVRSRLAGPTGWKRFTRKSVVAPVKIELKYLRDDDGGRIGQRLHFAFVVHADLAMLRDRDVMRRLFAGADQEASRSEEFVSESVDRKTLSELGLEIVDDGAAYQWLEFVLLKKVELRGMLRSARIDGEKFFALTWLLDPRFGDEPPGRYRNRWIRRERNELGQLQRGDPHVYSGAGGYLVVSELDEIEGASLVEAEIVLHEPEGWFSGSNLLRSKLPLVIQEAARNFRRELQSVE